MTVVYYEKDYLPGRNAEVVAMTLGRARLRVWSEGVLLDEW